MVMSKNKKKNEIDVQSFFSVHMDRWNDGAITITDLQGVKWSLKTRQGTFLTENEYNDIIATNMSFWDIADKYSITIEGRE